MSRCECGRLRLRSAPATRLNPSPNSVSVRMSPAKLPGLRLYWQAADREEPIPVGERVALGSIAARRLILRDERAEGESALRARHLGAVQRIDDPPRVDRRHHARIAAAYAREVEEPGALHEEGALLREEHREALVHLDLERIAFDLAEVRVQGRIERDRGRHPDLAAHSDFPVVVERGPPHRRGPLLLPGIRHARDQLPGGARLQLGELQRGVMLEHPLVRRQARPRHRHAQAAHAPPEQHAHPDLRAALEANRLQRQADFDGIALVVQPPRAVPDPVGRRVLTTTARVEHVELHAAGIHHQVIGDLAGPEGVEAEADPVVAPDVVAPRDAGLDAPRLGVVALERDVEVSRVVRNPHLRLLGDRVAVHRVVRRPAVGRERRALPDRIVERAIDDWWRAGADRGQCRDRLGGSDGRRWCALSTTRVRE